MAFQHTEKVIYENFGEGSVVDCSDSVNRGNLARKHSRNPDYYGCGMGGGSRVKKFVKEIVDIVGFTVILGVTVAVLAIWPPLLGVMMLGAALWIIFEGE